MARVEVKFEDGTSVVFEGPSALEEAVAFLNVRKMARGTLPSYPGWTITGTSTTTPDNGVVPK